MMTGLTAGCNRQKYKYQKWTQQPTIGFRLLFYLHSLIFNRTWLAVLFFWIVASYSYPHFGAFVLNFEHLNFDIVSDFDIRISDLLVLSSRHSSLAPKAHTGWYQHSIQEMQKVYLLQEALVAPPWIDDNCSGFKCEMVFLLSVSFLLSFLVFMLLILLFYIGNIIIAFHFFHFAPAERILILPGKIVKLFLHVPAFPH